MKEIFLRYKAKDIYNEVSRVLFQASVYAFVVSTPFMPFVFGIQGFAVPTINLFAFVYFVLQTTYTSLMAKVNWSKLIMPFSLSAFIAWLVMALANYWFFGRVAKMLWSHFKVV